MPKITHIKYHKENREKLNVFIDEKYCTTVRVRTFKGMGLKVGDEITCEELKKRDIIIKKKVR